MRPWEKIDFLSTVNLFLVFYEKGIDFPFPIFSLLRTIFPIKNQSSYSEVISGSYFFEVSKQYCFLG
ncbi:hypothetical protein BWD14_16065 [Leptospira santarosai]|uniref:Uncharacterized protein n=1 Tax=Leptospira santarosai TaxID=28183 RepID=A0AB73LL51_9LEPT|nr:hypothetical protein BWD14_16065 [Leptospira santarosai]